ncbi:hypothetical protein [Oscillibacter sp.]|uniref:hypothetical protein n=1 Tax=Oscillibacter sp. TaxID=1945593 RepID=UPI002D7F4446|nr:hypothetical protein [Oscillibacter sp.]
MPVPLHYIKKEMMQTSSKKYEITNIAHKKYPFLHRIRALRDVGDRVKAGDLGGFVEAERNLSQEDGDDAWIFDDAIAAGNAFVDKDSRLFGKAVACGSAYISQGASMSAEARAEDSAYVRGAGICGHARASGHSMILDSSDTGEAPLLSESCTVYGTVVGDVHVMGKAVILGEERITNDSPDTLIINGQERSIVRSPSRDELKPCQSFEKQEKSPKRKGIER